MKTQASRPDFPFTAVIGQESLKLALILVAIDRLIGGVLISGPRGSAKSTLARGLAGLLNDEQNHFVNLPLGAGEEMLTGTLNLQQVLNEKQVEFNPGLLSRAHDGVLYVDEVNLLADPLVDLLLDVAASGVNYVERDGVSHQHPSEFLLLGTMNPDEGELRPQLQDRFALAAYLGNEYSAEQRIAIVRQRKEFDCDPQAFCERNQDRQIELLQRLESARRGLSQVVLGYETELAIATACQAAKVDGLRADISWHRAAIAHAAWSGRTCVAEVDVDAVRELVLSHRRQAVNDSQNTPSPPPPTFSRPAETLDSDQKPDQPGQHDSEGNWGAMASVSQLSGNPRGFDPGVKHDDLNQSPSLASISTERSNGQNPMGYQRRIAGNTKRIDWFRTLAASANRQVWPPRIWLFQRPRGASHNVHLILLDTSASTLKGGLLAQAKGLVLGISEQVYLARQQMAVYCFGNQRWHCLQRLGRASKKLRGFLDHVECGGGTPLRLGVRQLAKILMGLKQQYPKVQSTSYIITDGRSSERIDDIRLPGQIFWLDTEYSVIKRGRGQQFAHSINAVYCPVAG